MALTASGPSGELRVGGRQAAKLRGWTYRTVGEGRWECQAPLIVTDAFLLEAPGSRELRLHIGEATWRYRGVEVVIAGDAMFARGEGKYEVL